MSKGATVAKRRVRTLNIWTRKESPFATSSGYSGSSVSLFHQRGLMFGFVPQQTGTSRQPVAMRVAANSTVTTSVGAKCGTKTSSTGLFNSRKHYQAFAGELPGI